MIRSILFTTLFVLSCQGICADEYPTISPSATFINSKGEEDVSESYTGSAPLKAYFYANAKNTDSWAATYIWRFYMGKNTSPYLQRYEENTEYTFTQAGNHSVKLYAIFTNGTDTISYTDEYWATEGQPVTVSISASSLEMPNAFSPNGDGINDKYQAKEGYTSIAEFKATIFNRWGQKLYEWTDPAGGWDGTFNGKDVKQGVYFVLVKAKGADGKIFNIKRDVNLLRGYTESSSR